MKKIFLIILVAASAAACKKDGSGSGKKLLLSKIFFNGLLNTEYIYNIDGKITRVNNYLNGGGQSTLTSYFIYEYNSEGRISEAILVNSPMKSKIPPISSAAFPRYTANFPAEESLNMSQVR